MVIVALDHVPHCFSQADGEIIRGLLAGPFSRGENVTLSLSGVQDVPSSFVNSSLVPFVEQYGAAWVKSHLRIVGATKQVGTMIRRCFDNAERRLLEAA